MKFVPTVRALYRFIIASFCFFLLPMQQRKGNKEEQVKKTKNRMPISRPVAQGGCQVQVLEANPNQL